MGEKYIFDMQVHSQYSWDCSTKVKDIIKYSKKIGISGISITDHETSKGGLKGYQMTKSDDEFTIIPSIEISTQFGDVIAMFTKDEVNTTDFFELKDIAKDEDMLLMLPHPGRGLEMAKKVAGDVDCIEVINGRSRITQNISSYFLRDKFDKTPVAGSDAHTLSEIGTCKTIYNGLSEDEIRNDLNKGLTQVKGLLFTAMNIPKWFNKKFIQK